jgi:hypothetical protein
MRKVLVALMLLVTCSGCDLPWGKQRYESYHPEIRDMAIYPGGRTRKVFFKDMAQFWDDAAVRKPSVEEILQRAYDLDTVLSAREAQIKAYNSWASEQNKANGYDIKEF